MSGEVETLFLSRNMVIRRVSSGVVDTANVALRDDTHIM
jgi:hypothetical protein